MHQDDQQPTDDKLDHRSIEEKKLAGGDGDGAKTADLVSTEEADQSRAPNLRICDFCGKTFTSGKALGGHRRSHFQALKAESRLKKKAKNHDANHHEEPTCGANISSDDKRHTCCLCGKDFPSMKSLFGHMKSHPDRVWKGILPPPTSCPAAAALGPSQSEEKGCSSSSTSSGHGEYNKDMDCDVYKMMNPDASSNISAAVPVDLLKDLSRGSRWNVTAKRRRESVGAFAAAMCLLDLSRGKYLPSKINNHCIEKEDVKIYESSLAKRRGVDHGLAENDEKHNEQKMKLICRRLGPVKLGDKAVYESCPERSNWFDPSLHNMDNPHDDGVDNAHHRLKKESKNPEVDQEGTKSKENADSYKKKMKKNRKMNMLNTKSPDRYKCGRCTKTFPTFQALGGHRSIHNKDKNSIPSMDGETTAEASIVQKALINDSKERESTEVSDTMTEEANHNSKYCKQTFVGSLDHASLMSKESESGQQSVTGEATESSGKMLGVDLNLPYTMEDEDMESASFSAPFQC